MSACRVTDCDRPARSLSLCQTHYKRHARGVSLTTPIRKRGLGFDSWVDKTAECWIWRGTTQAKGYGRFNAPGTASPMLAHRYSYEQIYGPIPQGMQIDHRCRNTSCVRPDHLEVVTAAENLRRARESK